MNKATVGFLGVSIATAAAWLAVELTSDERAGASLGSGSVSPPSIHTEEVEGSSRPRPPDSDEVTKEVAQAMTAGMVDALGDAKMRLRDHVAESKLAQQTPRQPPNGVELPTDDELARIREVRRTYGDRDLIGNEESQQNSVVGGARCIRKTRHSGGTWQTGEPVLTLPYDPNDNDMRFVTRVSGNFKSPPACASPPAAHSTSYAQRNPTCCARASGTSTAAVTSSAATRER